MDTRSPLILAVVIASLLGVPAISAAGGPATTSHLHKETGISTTAIEIVPENQTTNPGHSVTYSVVLADATNGVGAFDNITVTLNDTDVAKISSITTNVSSGANTGIIAEGRSAYVNVPFGGETNQTGEVTLATVTVTSKTPGTTAVELYLTGNIATENGSLYSITETRDGLLSVEDPKRPVTVALHPSHQTMATDSHASIDLVVENATRGVGAFDALKVTIDNPTIAKISNISTSLSTAARTQISSEGSNASITIPFGGDPNHEGDVTVATIRLNGSATGRATLSVTVTGTIVDTVGIAYDVMETEGAKLNVTASPTEAVIEEGGTPTNPDNDAQFEDINGNGYIDIGDIQALFQNMNSKQLSQYEGLFDWNGNGKIDIGDVQALFTDYKSTSTVN